MSLNARTPNFKVRVVSPSMNALLYMAFRLRTDSGPHFYKNAGTEPHFPS